MEIIPHMVNSHDDHHDLLSKSIDTYLGEVFWLKYAVHKTILLTRKQITTKRVYSSGNAC
jgi:hypothetical protein